MHPTREEEQNKKLVNWEERRTLSIFAQNFDSEIALYWGRLGPFQQQHTNIMNILRENTSFY